MEISAKIIMDVMLENESEALEILNKSRDNELDNVKIIGMSKNIITGMNVVMKNVCIETNGVFEDVYCTNEINYSLIRSIKKMIDMDDLISINGITYFIMLLPDNKLNLYAMKERIYYFDNNLNSIQEIMDKFEEDNVVYEIYVVR